MEFRVLGWHDDPAPPRLRLHHERYAYAGKFVVPTGIAAALADGADVPAIGRDHDGRDRSDALDEHEGRDEHDGRDALGEYAEGVLAAAAFDEDRTDADTLVVRYVTTEHDRRGEGIGTRLLAFVAARAHEDGYGRVRIAVNNAYSYEACAKAGFGFTGDRTGLAELVMVHPAPDRRWYEDGLAVFSRRDLTTRERAFVDERRERGPPDVVDVPTESDER